MSLRIESFVAGPLDTNAYLVIDEQTNDALVIDAPVDVTERIKRAVESFGANIRRIVITHTHWDHIGDAAKLRQTTGAPLAAHPLARAGLERPSSPLGDLPFEIEPVTPDEELDDGDLVKLGEHEFTVMHLPGHDPAHIALYSEADAVFLGGDVLFPNGHGRTDIAGASDEEMAKSLSRLSTLPPDVTVYPGHGATTTIGQEASWLQTYRPKGGAS